MKILKEILLIIFDFIFPRRDDDAAIVNLSPKKFYATVPRWNEEAYPNIQAIFHYQHPQAMAMVKEIKSFKSRHGAAIAGYALAKKIDQLEIHSAILVPIPLSKKRRKERGYNQCELVLRSLSPQFLQERDLEIRTDLLERVKDSPKSALQGRAGRIAAATGIFTATCDLSAESRPIIIIDDVVTTGSTMTAAMETLRQAGTKNVSGIAISH
ncbi:MAG: ComF family protein [Patescibacteria group bacterium]|nr:ComF family protein [Patescibacteria group bacterium]